MEIFYHKEMKWNGMKECSVKIDKNEMNEATKTFQMTADSYVNIDLN